MFFWIGFLLFFILKTSFSLSITPLRVNLSVAEPIATMRLVNDSDEAIVLQLNAVKWTQKNDQEIEKASEDILITPQIFTLKPSESQLIRLGMESSLAKPYEGAYRLIIQEVKKTFPKKQGGVHFLLRFSVPIMIASTVPIVKKIQWTMHQTLHGGQLQAVNAGTNIVFINQIALLSQSSQYIVNPFSTFSYLLPGGKKEWKWQVSSPQIIRKVQARINNKLIIYDVA